MFVKIKEAAKILGLHPNTLRAYAKQGKIEHIVTSGGHRRFNVESFQKACGVGIGQTEEQDGTQGKGAIYARVSSSKQQDDLERQIQHLKETYPDYEVFRDIASGINFKRRGLQRLLERVQSGDITEVVVAHKDRLARFGVELIQWIISQAGGTLVILDQSQPKPEQELAEDLMSIVHVFACRYHGRRRYKDKAKPKRKRKKKSTQARVQGAGAGQL